MTIDDLIHRCPKTLTATLSNDAAVGHLRDDCFATCGVTNATWKLIDVLDEDHRIWQRAEGLVVSDDACSAVLPCYSFGAADMAVATGRVFVRFAAHATAQDHEGELKQAGYRIDSVPPQQPHTAWCTPTSGLSSDGLSTFARLADVETLEYAELQLLRKRAARQGAVAAPPTN